MEENKKTFFFFKKRELVHFCPNEKAWKVVGGKQARSGARFYGLGFYFGFFCDSISGFFCDSISGFFCDSISGFFCTVRRAL